MIKIGDIVRRKPKVPLKRPWAKGPYRAPGEVIDIQDGMAKVRRHIYTHRGYTNRFNCKWTPLDLLEIVTDADK